MNLPASRGVSQVVRSCLRRHRLLVGVTLAVSLLAVLAESLGIGLFIPLLQTLSGATPTRGVSWLGDQITTLFDAIPAEYGTPLVAAAIFATVAVKSALSYATGACYALLDSRVSHEMRSRLFSRILRMEFAEFERIPSDRLFNTLAGETWRASVAITVLMEMAVSVGALVVYAVVLLLINWKATIAVGLAMGLLSGCVRWVHRWSKAIGRRATEANKGFTNRMLEGVAGNEVIRCLHRQGHEQATFDKASERVSSLFLRLGLVRRLIDPFYELAAAVLFIALLLFSRGGITGVASMLVFLAILYRMQPRVRSLDAKRSEFAALVAPLEEVAEILLRDEVEDDQGKAECPPLTESIVVDDVWFTHASSSAPALRGATFEIPVGRVTALVGPSGSGKSTAARLILGIYTPDKGRVLLDGVPLSQTSTASWLDQTAVVSQNAHVFNCSIEENIRYGRLEATREEIVEAARMADAHDFIVGLADDYRTLVGDRATRLSGGQKQRIALARAFVRRPAVLILDEATSSVDRISENAIVRSVRQELPDCTIVVVAHRLSSITFADHVVVLQSGEVLQRGNVEQLLAQGGLFAELYG